MQITTDVNYRYREQGKLFTVQTLRFLDLTIS
jgi:hypothetical protein